MTAARPIVAGHDFRASTYVEDGDWTSPAVCRDVIGGNLCVVRSHWLPITG